MEYNRTSKNDDIEPIDYHPLSESESHSTEEMKTSGAATGADSSSDTSSEDVEPVEPVGEPTAAEGQPRRKMPAVSPILRLNAVETTRAVHAGSCKQSTAENKTKLPCRKGEEKPPSPPGPSLGLIVWNVNHFSAPITNKNDNNTRRSNMSNADRLTAIRVMLKYCDWAEVLALNEVNESGGPYLKAEMARLSADPDFPDELEVHLGPLLRSYSWQSPKEVYPKPNKSTKNQDISEFSDWAEKEYIKHKKERRKQRGKKGQAPPSEEKEPPPEHWYDDQEFVLRKAEEFAQDLEDRGENGAAFLEKMKTYYAAEENGGRKPMVRYREYYPIVFRKSSGIRVVSVSVVNDDGTVIEDVQEEKEYVFRDTTVPRKENPHHYRPAVVYHLVKVSKDKNGNEVNHMIDLAVIHTTPAGNEFDRREIYNKQLGPILGALDTSKYLFAAGDYYVGFESLVEDQEGLTPEEKKATMKKKNAMRNTHALTAQTNFPEGLEGVGSGSGTNRSSKNPDPHLETKNGFPSLINHQVADYGMIAIKRWESKAVGLLPGPQMIELLGRAPLLLSDYMSQAMAEWTKYSDHAPVGFILGPCCDEKAEEKVRNAVDMDDETWKKVREKLNVYEKAWDVAVAKRKERERTEAQEFRLHMMYGVENPDRIPTESTNRIIVADVNGVLHFRIFDGEGNMLVDTDMQTLTEQLPEIEEVREELLELLHPHNFKKHVAEAIDLVLAIVYHPQVMLPDLRGLHPLEFERDPYERLPDPKQQDIQTKQGKFVVHQKLYRDLAEQKEKLSNELAKLKTEIHKNEDPDHKASQKKEYSKKLKDYAAVVKELDQWKKDLEADKPKKKKAKPAADEKPAETKRKGREPEETPAKKAKPAAERKPAVKKRKGGEPEAKPAKKAKGPDREEGEDT